MTTARHLFLAATLLSVSPVTVSGSVIINMVESNGDVVVNASGSLNVDALLPLNVFGTSDDIFVDPDSARLFIGIDASVTINRYRIPLGPEVFGPGMSATNADTGAGDRIGIVGITSTYSNLFVPDGYISGTALSSSATFNGATIASLGLSDGAYVYSWGSDESADSLTVNIQSAAVPEQSSFITFVLLSFAGLCLQRRRLSGCLT